MRADAQRNRDRIVVAAERLLARRPNATLEEVFPVAGVGRTTLYRHFPTREALVEAVYDLAFVDAQRLMTAAGLDSCPGAELLDRAVAAAFEVLACHPILAKGVPYEDADGTPEARCAAALRPLEIGLRRAQDAGRLRGDLPTRWLSDTLVMNVAAAVDHEAALRNCGADPQALVREAFVAAWHPGGR